MDGEQSGVGLTWGNAVSPGGLSLYKPEAGQGRGECGLWTYTDPGYNSCSPLTCCISLNKLRSLALNL